MRNLSPGQLAQRACFLEVTARKPGNVHVFRDFDDACYRDFILSASAIGPPLERAASIGVGASILESIKATRDVVATNTNLGMILLLAPMASVPIGQDLREGVNQVLEGLTIEDARLAYQAIRRANPGGLGLAHDQDVDHEPTINLREAMRLAADRDRVARQYDSGFADVFDGVLPKLQGSFREGRPVEVAIILAYLDFLARHPDTLIARKRGDFLAREASNRAAKVLELGWPDRSEGITAFGAFDHWLRLDGHARNPGATADLIAAALFAFLRDEIIPHPITWSQAGVWSTVGGR